MLSHIRWTNNTCADKGTCIHVFADKEGLVELKKLCPSGDFVCTNYEPKLYGSFSNPDDLDLAGLTHKPRGYYFFFTIADGGDIINWLIGRGLKPEMNIDKFSKSDNLSL